MATFKAQTPYEPPAWLAAKQEESAAIYGPASYDTPEYQDNPEDAQREAVEHATRMGVNDLTAGMRQIMTSENIAPVVQNPARGDEQQRPVTVSVGQAEASHESLMQETLIQKQLLEAASPPQDDAQMKSPEPSASSSIRSSRSSPGQEGVSSDAQSTSRETSAQPGKQTKAPSTNSAQPMRREKAMERKDERKAKKKTFRLNQKRTEAEQSASDSSSSAAVTPTTVTTPVSRTTPETGPKDEPDLMEVDNSSSLFVASNDRYPVKDPPAWYRKVTPSHTKMQEVAKRRPQAVGALDALKNCIVRCEVEKKALRLGPLFDELRNHVHKAEFLLPPEKIGIEFVLRRANILGETGLPRIFKEEANFPPDLKADAYQLYSRWWRGDFSQDILRGIVTVKGKDRNGDRLEPAYRKLHPTSAKYYGEGDLVLGQWWPTQLCAVRDGAHGSSQGGIYGDKEEGTYSIVLSGGGGYHDKDDGDVIEYSGTDGKNFTPTDNTLAMVKSAQKGNEIRVIRSSQLVKKNPYRPEVGLRYDGLYVVKSFAVVNLEKQIHRFRLERCPGQEPIRSGKNAAARPTLQEILEYERNKAKW